MNPVRVLFPQAEVMAARWMHAILLLMIFLPVTANSQNFSRINSGTKSDIRQIRVTNDGSVCFLTDKIYVLEGDAWKKSDYPITGSIDTFEPISKDDIWFSTTLETSTSMLYHHHNGITENVHSPFANNISFIGFKSKQLGFFASYSDVIIYKNGLFEQVRPVGNRGFIFKVYGMSSEEFWVLSQYNEFFNFKDGKYQRVFAGRMVKDFQMIAPGHGFVLCEDAILEVNGTKVLRQYRNALLKTSRKICIHDDKIWVVGEHGLILVQENGILRQVKYNGKETLNSIDFGLNNEIWISGENGLLLYCGDKEFPAYNESYPGFSSKKLITFGIEVDNEYGVALSDFNGDNYTDIYAVCISDPDRLYVNKMDPVHKSPDGFLFREEAAKRGVLESAGKKPSPVPSELKLGVATADVDNDGDEDVYLASLNGKNKLLLNNGKGFFRNVSEQGHRACDDMHRSNAAAFADVDLDGDLDLFATSEQGSNRLYLNDGNAYFTDVTEKAGISSTGGGMCASFSDVNEDGYPDLCVTFWYPSNRIYLNESRNGKVKFREITETTDLSKSEPAKSNAVVFADVNNDGHSDLFIANRHASNKLYLNDGKGAFRDVTTTWFGNHVYLTNGAVFADFDLDGYQDLYITNVGENVMYRNIHGKYFEEVTGKFGAELNGYCTGCAAGDVDNDGDVDLYAANYINGSSKLFLNKMEKKNAVTIKISGTISNRNGVGTKVFLYACRAGGKADSLAGFREISGGGGYGSASAKEAIFALMPGTDYYAVVTFPASGKMIKTNKIVAGSVVRIDEQVGVASFKTLARKAVIRIASDPEARLEIVKFAAVLMMLITYLRIQRKGPSQIRLTRMVVCLTLFILFLLVNQLFLYSSSILLFFVSPLLVIIGLTILHLVTERILLKRQAEQEKTELREKISRDLHDDLASTLGSISIYSSTLKGMDGVSPLNFQKLSAKISELTQTALQSITDIIWMTSPRNDSLRSLLLKVSALMFDVLNDNGINFIENIQLPEHEVVLSEKLRHDTFLILKEAMNNVIRHADAKQVNLWASYNGSTCVIRLTDDGKGFLVKDLPRKGSHGNGLVNMRRRASESGINLQVQSGTGSGSQIELTFNI
ncbi:MAG: FG-GAP-like repeat-containing protein [Bacteroidales bacterium]